ncbi:MAG: protein phosphatase 2C domain-containing protein [Magnetococcales bacterium]|nr:protein phosphatase 2C domain-containing protein [Magnetococcales bacterium]
MSGINKDLLTALNRAAFLAEKYQFSDPGPGYRGYRHLAKRWRYLLSLLDCIESYYQKKSEQNMQQDQYGTDKPVITSETDARNQADGFTPLNQFMSKTLHLKNARAGEVYVGTLELEGLKGLKLQDAGGSGLKFEETTAQLRGMPTGIGDFQLRFQGLLHGSRTEIVANLAVIPDPKSLWVKKDSDSSDPFWKPDEASSRVEGDLLCVAASKRGRSHAREGGIRDDDFGLLADGPGGWHIAVVADGAGSAKFARRGSKVACDSVLQGLPVLLDQHVTPQLERLVGLHLQRNSDASAQIIRQLYQSLATSAFQAAKAIVAEAECKGGHHSAFSTTLILGVARKITHGWFLAGFSIGDGGAAVFDVGDASLTTLTLPDSGEFAGQTRFLQSSEFASYEDVAKRIFFDIRKSFTAMVLMTDGISDPKFPTESAFADPARWVSFWNDDLSPAVGMTRDNAGLEQQLLAWLDFWSSGNHDDRTLAVLVP